jgi:ABC-type polysaccharide transport system permease subunit
MLGTNIIIFLTGMATLDQTLIEAARVDGLSRLADLLPGHRAAAQAVHPVLVRDHGHQRVSRRCSA